MASKGPPGCQERSKSSLRASKIDFGSNFGAIWGAVQELLSPQSGSHGAPQTWLKCTPNGLPEGVHNEGRNGFWRPPGRVKSLLGQSLASWRHLGRLPEAFGVQFWEQLLASFLAPSRPRAVPSFFFSAPRASQRSPRGFLRASASMMQFGTHFGTLWTSLGKPWSIKNKVFVLYVLQIL